MATGQYSTFKSQLEVAVIDRHGRPAGLDRAGKPITRMLANPPIQFLYPNEPIIFINWLWEQEKGYVPKPEELLVDVPYQGRIYRGHWGWGSSVKRGLTIGLTRDLLRESGLGKKAEDGQRVGRWLLANCQYGAATGKLKVKYALPGEVFNGLPLEDGFAYISRSLAAVVDKSRTARRYAAPEDASDSFHFAQRVPWTPEVRDEALPFIQQAIDEIATRKLHVHVSSGMEDRKHLVAAEEGMLLHPYVANALRRSEKDTALRLATSIPTGSKVRVAVPTHEANVALGGQVIITRYPIDAWNSMRALIGEGSEAEERRIAAMETIQYTLASPILFDKGAAGIVSDSALGGFDMVICSENVKMATGEASHLRDQGGEIDLDGAFIGFVMRYQAGKALGVDPKLWKSMGGDYDGDNVILTPCEGRPALWDAVAKFPEQETPKLFKTKSKLGQGKRAEMICRSMLNIVGFATNVAAATFAVADREMLADMLGYRGGAAAMDKQLNYAIKVGTDIFKVSVEPREVNEQLARLQSGLTEVLGRSVPWVRWAKDEWAFVNGVPMPYDPSMGTNKNDPIVRNSVPTRFNGTVAQIARYVLPQLKVSVEQPIQAHPLSYFRAWSVSQPEEILQVAKRLQVAFNNRVGSVNFSDPEDVESFRTWWDVRVREWLDTGVDRMAAANALWEVAHDTESTRAGAASVFYAFPEEVDVIVREKPGLKMRARDGLRTIVLGLNPKVEKVTCRVLVEKAEVLRENVVFIGRVIKTEDPALMVGKTAAIALDAEQPEPGEYTAHITRRNKKDGTPGKSWVAVLVN